MTLQLRPSTVMILETRTTSQIRWRWKAREREVEHRKRADPMLKEETQGRGIQIAKAVIRRSSTQYMHLRGTVSAYREHSTSRNQ